MGMVVDWADPRLVRWDLYTWSWTDSLPARESRGVRPWIGPIAVLGGVGLSGAGTVWILRKIWGVVSAADPNVAAALIAASATVIVSVLSVVIGRWIENRSRIAEEQRQKKAPIYQELQEFFFKVLFAKQMGKTQPPEKEMIRFFAEFVPRFSVWASNDVVRAFLNFRNASSDASVKESDRGARLMFLYEQLIFQIRKDLGHSGTGIEPGSILALFINDMDSLTESKQELPSNKR